MSALPLLACILGWLAFGWLAGRLYLITWRGHFGSVDGEIGTAIWLTLGGPISLASVTLYWFGSRDHKQIPASAARFWGAKS